MEKPSLFTKVRNFFILLGSGAFSAQQALRTDMFPLPPMVHLYLSYLFSLLSLAGICMAGKAIFDYASKGNDLLKKMKQVDIENKTE